MSENKRCNKKFLLCLIGILLVVLSAIATLIYAFATNNLSKLPVPARVRILGEYKIANGEWKELDYDKTIPSNKGDVTLRGKLVVTDEEGKFITSVKNGAEITLYFNHINATMFINGQQVHVFDIENPRIGHQACVKDWINYKYTGQEDDIVELVIHNQHKFGNGNAVNDLLDSMYWGNTTIWQDFFIQKGVFERTIGFFVIIITFITVGVAFFATNLKLKNVERLWYVSLISFFAGGCLIFSSENITLWNKEAILDNYGLVISLILVFFFTLCLITSIFGGKIKKVAIGLTILLGMSNIILFIGVCKKLINIYDVLLPFAIICFTISLIMIIACIWSLFKTYSKKERILLICCAVFLLSIMFDIMMQGFYLSKVVFMCIFLIGIIVSIIEIPKHFAVALKTSELERQLQEQKLSSMISQIQPHFIFNALTTIIYLCEENPELAKETLERFSFFLRGTIESLEMKECVTINRELEIVKNYLYVEKQRFGEKLEIEYDIKSEDFMIPMLSIQPVVENAVRHGIRSRLEGGKVTISTSSEKDYHVVKILDNGVGFLEELTDKDGNIHVGIKNVKERIKLMTGGSVEVLSNLEVGTEVIIKIPKKSNV